MPIESNAITSETDPIYTAEKNSKQDKSEKGQANGYCGLDGGGKVALGNLPASILKYVGVWDASTNTPTLTSPDLSKFGYVYNVSVAGTQFGISFKLGDWAIYNDSGVIEKSDNSDDVTSVNGRTGAVTGLANLTGGNTFTGNQTFDTNTLFVDSVNHKVGVGAISPSYRLDIKGAGTNNEVLARFYGDTNTIGSFVIKSKTTGVPGMAIGTYGNKERLALLTANVERINIDGDGNVGIGTTSPGSILTVKSGLSDGTTAFDLQNSGGTSVFSVSSNGAWNSGAGKMANILNIGFANTNIIATNKDSVFAWTSAASPHFPNNADTGISRGSANKIYIGNGTGGDYSGTLVAGNVGIGTTNPSAKLDVSGQGKFTSTAFPVVDILRDTTTSSGGIYGGAKLERLMTGGTATAGTGIGFYFKVPDSNGNSTFAGIFGGALSTVTDGAEVGDIVFSASWLGADPYQNQHLIIRATGATTGNVLIPNGNVGIGTTNPAKKLEISNANNTTISATLRFSDSNVGGNYFDIGTPNGSSGFIINQGNTQVMRIRSNGNVNFGTGATPFARLTVQKSDTIDYFGITDTIDGDVMVIKNSGNVGIGTTSPASKLQVVGLKEYADNAAAIAAGLTAGAFYRTGDLLKVVH